jgi:hypothetical protein
VRDRETYRHRLLAAVRRSIRAQGGQPSSRPVDELLAMASGSDLPDSDTDLPDTLYHYTDINGLR